MAPSTPMKVERAVAPDHREIFTNYSEVKFTIMDVLLRFCVMRDAMPGQVTVTNVVDVAMSPEQAKALHRALGGIIGAYEKQYGQIPQEATPAGQIN